MVHKEKLAFQHHRIHMQTHTYTIAQVLLGVKWYTNLKKKKNWARERENTKTLIHQVTPQMPTTTKNGPCQSQGQELDPVLPHGPRGLKHLRSTRKLECGVEPGPEPGTPIWDVVAALNAHPWLAVLRGSTAVTCSGPSTSHRKLLWLLLYLQINFKVPVP